MKRFFIVLLGILFLASLITLIILAFTGIVLLISMFVSPIRYETALAIIGAVVTVMGIFIAFEITFPSQNIQKVINRIYEYYDSVPFKEIREKKEVWLELKKMQLSSLWRKLHETVEKLETQLEEGKLKEDKVKTLEKSKRLIEEYTPLMEKFGTAKAEYKEKEGVIKDFLHSVIASFKVRLFGILFGIGTIFWLLWQPFFWKIDPLTSLISMGNLQHLIAALLLASLWMLVSVYYQYKRNIAESKSLLNLQRELDELSPLLEEET